MVLVFWFLNFFISIVNAWGCGKTWLSTKRKGGLAHFMNWMGAIMSASGFTWCYTLVLGALFSEIPFTDKETGVSAPLVTPEMLTAIIDLGYLVIIFPILGSGLAITVSSWRYAARSRSFGDSAIAGWNTYAQISNTMSAMREIPNIMGRLSGFFGGGSSSSSSDDKKGAIVIFIVAVALLGGILTTFGIIRMTAEGTILDENMKAEEQRARQRAAEKLKSVGGSTPAAARSVATPMGTRSV